MKTLLLLLFFPGIVLSQLSATLSADNVACLNAPSPSLTFTGLNGTAPYTFSYTINGGSVQQISGTMGSTAELMIPTNSAGTFNYQLIEVEDAVGINASVIDDANFTINPLPFVNAGLDQSVCPGISVTLTASGAVIYSWNNGVTNGVSFVPSSTATYTVTGTDANGCINTDQVTVFVECANLEEESMNEVMIFPVPATDILTIETHLSLQEVLVFNEVGQQVYSSHVNGMNCKLDIRGLNSGVYYIHLVASPRTYHTKFFKL
jgi:hypothetical protein